MSSEPLSVLLVEDNPGDANLVQHHFRRSSFPGVADEQDLTRVETLEAALSAVETESFDLVLLDLGLPETTGIETLERFLPEAADFPVVVLTGLDDKETAIQAIQHGAQDYLPKGDLDTDTLMRSVRYAIERKKQEVALRRQTERIRFFSDVSRHDVGNGMEVIRRNAQLLSEGLDGEDGERAGTIVDWADDIVDLTGKVRRMLETATDDGDRDLEPVDVSSAVSERAAVIASMDGVSVETDVPDGVYALADDMLPEVVGNLLSNAVEHNDAEQPRVTVEVTDDEGTVEVTVADNGPGIPDELKAAVFGRGASSDAEGGFGLYFVATMVESYGGEVSVEDRSQAEEAATGAGGGDETGSVLRLTLPAADDPQAF